jgi:hypothetical protein
LWPRRRARVKQGLAARGGGRPPYSPQPRTRWERGVDPGTDGRWRERAVALGNGPYPIPCLKHGVRGRPGGPRRPRAGSRPPAFSREGPSRDRGVADHDEGGIAGLEPGRVPARDDGRLYYRTEDGPMLLIEPSPKAYLERGAVRAAGPQRQARVGTSRDRERKTVPARPRRAARVRHPEAGAVTRGAVKRLLPRSGRCALARVRRASGASRRPPRGLPGAAALARARGAGRRSRGSGRP